LLALAVAWCLNFLVDLELDLKASWKQLVDINCFRVAHSQIFEF